MNPHLTQTAIKLAVALLAFWLLRPALATARFIFALMRAPLWPARLLPADAGQIMSADQKAALDEVEGLGFVVHSQRLAEHGRGRFPLVFLLHESEPALAVLSFRATLQTGYPVSFATLAAQGTVYLTTNRVGWMKLVDTPGISSDDPYAGNLGAHWQAHRARIAGLAEQAERPAAAESVLELIARLVDYYEDYVPALGRAGLTAQIDGVEHFTLPAAWRLLRAWRAAARRLGQPYVSRLTQDPELVDGFRVHCYLESEVARAGQAARADLKGWLLALSLFVSLIAWGIAFSWLQAGAIVAILLVHESGHALAMRVFGYRDMSMFFVPFLGAIVTGTPRAVAAWKQAVILFAGPVPGLIAALAFLVGMVEPRASVVRSDAVQIAVLALGINLFNLLPITPLDGGRLVEIALLARWPRARLVFVVVSIVVLAAIAAWTGSIAAWVIAAALAVGFMTQVRLARLQNAWQEGLDESGQLRNLFAAARRARVEPFNRQYGLIRAVLTQRQIHLPRLWESLVILLVIVALWWGSVWSTRVFWMPGAGSEARADARAPAERDFDRVLADLDDSEEEPSAQALAELESLAKRLDPKNPRQVELLVVRARTGAPGERDALYLAALARPTEGTGFTQPALAREYLADSYARHRAAAAPARAEALRAAIDATRARAPGALPGTFEAELRYVEAIDEAGETTRAAALLDRLREASIGVDSCECALREVVRARAWFELAHGWPDRALAALAAPPLSLGPESGDARLRLDYAWALLYAGRIPEGLEAMLRATRLAARRPAPSSATPSAPPATAQDTPPRYRQPLDLAAALVRAGRDDEARSLVRASERMVCFRARGAYEPRPAAPWQSAHEAELVQTARALCPAEEAGGASARTP